jgi:hypothetical protein
MSSSSSLASIVTDVTCVGVFEGSHIPNSSSIQDETLGPRDANRALPLYALHVLYTAPLTTETLY